LRVVIARGKGGMGKSTFAANLAVTAVVAGLDVRLLDCDVEESDRRLFLWPGLQQEELVTVVVSEIARELREVSGATVPGCA
jgi:MinD superfamily P-loop ATPase